MVSKYFVGILNSWISIPTKYTKLDIQRIKMISQYQYSNVRFSPRSSPGDSRLSPNTQVQQSRAASTLSNHARDPLTEKAGLTSVSRGQAVIPRLLVSSICPPPSNLPPRTCKKFGLTSRDIATSYITSFIYAYCCAIQDAIKRSNYTRLSYHSHLQLFLFHVF